MPVVFVNVTVVALTAPLNVVPPEFVIVKVPMSVPILELNVTPATELMVIFDDEPEAVPVTEFTVIRAGPPLPKVNVTPSRSVTLPSTTGSFGLT